MKKSLFLSLFLIIIFTSCEKLSKKHVEGTFSFDMVGTGQSTNKLKSISVELDSSISFCKLSKFEIEILYVFIQMYDESNPKETSYHTLLNRKHHEGVKVDLVNEKLSDKIALSLENPIGINVKAFIIGLESSVMVNGYIDSLGTVVRSTADGFVSDGGISEDYNMNIEGAWEEIYSRDSETPMADENIIGFQLNLPESGDCRLIQVSDSSKLEIRWLMDAAIQLNINTKEWQIADHRWATPFISDQFVYEIYQLKRKDKPFYTDIMSAMFDKEGYACVNAINIGQIVYNRENVLQFSSWFGYDDFQTSGLYEQHFKKNGDGSVWFKVTVGGGSTNIFTSFKRENHFGTVETDNGEIVEYECIKIE